MFLVSINLLTFNGRRFIENCLESVFNQTYPKLELLIIDNASQDDTLTFTQEIISKKNPRFPVRIIKNEKNLGFSAGHNLGIRESRGELVLCLNQDVVLAPDFIEKAVEFFEKDRQAKIAALQPKLLRLDKESQPASIIDTTGLVMLKNRRIVNCGQGQKDEGQHNITEEVFGADGAAPVYRREALDDIAINASQRDNSALSPRLEWLDEDFFMYKEDVDLAWRLRLYGWKTFFVPSVLAWHARGAGESAATDYVSIIKERRKIGQFPKIFSFRNQRLMQIKNELWSLLFRHLPRFLLKEIGAWLYVLLFEPYTFEALKELVRLAPRAWKKRKIIMANKKVSDGEMRKWFV